MQPGTAARRLAAGVFGAMLALASPTRADDALPEPARAAALLREGRRLVAEGRFDEACPKLVAAQKLQPTTDGAIEIGDCFEKAAKAAFAEARTLARRAADDAEQRIAHLEHPSPATAPIEAAPPAAVPPPPGPPPPPRPPPPPPPKAPSPRPLRLHPRCRPRLR
jgi:hypothetical protein